MIKRKKKFRSTKKKKKKGTRSTNLIYFDAHHTHHKTLMKEEPSMQNAQKTRAAHRAGISCRKHLAVFQHGLKVQLLSHGHHSQPTVQQDILNWR